MSLQESIQLLIQRLQDLKNLVRDMQKGAEQQEILLAIDDIVSADRTLQQAISQEIERQKMLDEISALKQKEAELKNESRNFVQTVLSELITLEPNIMEDEQRVEKLRSRHKNAEHLSRDQVLRAALSLSYTQGPPYDWQPGASLRLNKPPYPTEDLMRSSLLFRKMNLLESNSAMDIVKSESGRNPIEARHHGRNQDDYAPSSFDIMDLDLNPDLI